MQCRRHLLPSESVLRSFVVDTEPGSRTFHDPCARAKCAKPTKAGVCGNVRGNNGKATASHRRPLSKSVRSAAKIFGICMVRLAAISCARAPIGGKDRS